MYSIRKRWLRSGDCSWAVEQRLAMGNSHLWVAGGGPPAADIAGSPSIGSVWPSTSGSSWVLWTTRKRWRQASVFLTCCAQQIPPRDQRGPGT